MARGKWREEMEVSFCDGRVIRLRGGGSLVIMKEESG